MVSFCLDSNNGVLGNPQNNKFCVLQAKSFKRCACRSSSAMPRNVGSSFYSFNSNHSSFCGEVVCYSKIRSLVDETRENRVANMEDRKPIDVKRRFSLRLRPRLRLLSRRLIRVPIRSALNDFGMFLRRNMKKIALVTLVSVALGICYLFVKIMTIPSPRMVPYSDLVMSLQTGSVSKVLFEEGSRRIYFNSKVQSVELESPQMEDENLPLDCSQTETVAGEVAIAATSTPQVKGTKVITKSTQKRAAMPEWQYSTRKVENDESFLLSLMREKGLTYSSAPPSVLMSIRSILITILTLWIPLTPLMWLLYRQLYSANNPAKKRKPSNQTFSFYDVEGVDSAKVELMEDYTGFDVVAKRRRVKQPLNISCPE